MAKMSNTCTTRKKKFNRHCSLVNHLQNKYACYIAELMDQQRRALSEEECLYEIECNKISVAAICNILIVEHMNYII